MSTSTAVSASPELAEVLRHPRTLEATIELRFIDPMGHMNVAWYVHLFDRATWVLLGSLGLDEAHMAREHSGAFAVEQTVRYFAELRLGDRIEIRSAIDELAGKRIRFRHAMVDLARGRVAATIENVGLHVDRRTRRATPFPDAIVAAARERMAR